MNLSSLVHSTKRLEREAKRAGILTEPPPPPLSDQEQAEHDRLIALVDQFATENEQAELAFSTMAGAHVQFGFTLTKLVRIADSDDDEEGPPLEYDPAALAAVTARTAMRQELKLPARECVRRKPEPEASHCVCLREAVDAAIASGRPTTRDDVLQAARREHGERWAWLKRKPYAGPLLPTRNPEVTPAPRPKPLPKPKADVVTETPTKPFRVVRKVRRWYDQDTPRPSDFRDSDLLTRGGTMATNGPRPATEGGRNDAPPLRPAAPRPKAVPPRCRCRGAPPARARLSYSAAVWSSIFPWSARIPRACPCRISLPVRLLLFRAASLTPLADMRGRGEWAGVT